MNNNKIITKPETKERKPNEVTIQPIHTTLFKSDDPKIIINKATRIAQEVSSIIEKKRVYNLISGKKYVRVEGWTTMGAMLGLFPSVEFCRRVQTNDNTIAYETRVAIKTLDGREITSAESICDENETSGGKQAWKGRPEYAIKSMSQTRATSKAFRLCLSWIMILAGYEPTPAEEMIDKEPVVIPQKQAPEVQKSTSTPIPGSQSQQEKQVQEFVDENKITTPQMKMLMSLLTQVCKKYQLDATDENIKKVFVDLTGKQSRKDLTKDEASKQIDLLQKVIAGSVDLSFDSKGKIIVVEKQSAEKEEVI